MEQYMNDHAFYYERYLIKNYNSKVVLAMIKLMNGNRKSSFTISQLSKVSGESKHVTKTTVYKMIDEYMINKLRIEFIPAEYSANEMFVVQFPLKMEDFSYLYEFEIDDLLDLDNAEVKVFLSLFGLMKNSNDYKLKKIKNISIGRDTIARLSGVKNLNTLSESIESLEEKEWLKIIDKGNNLKTKNTKYELLKDYKIR
ncbi:hypothetical protein [Bacillus cereus group sp. BfR-BA-01523]|uniref:hypothetical protein n=1 Tax=Bacillus cereus group sp. BfR-BA-01523 TaxID=2920371 RepID=UPI001F58E8C8|nr:hypothetical protein [Bacillus cereus group sp. BfR-BA-01523]